MENNHETFLEATIYQAELENPVRHSVLFVNKRHILWSSPEEGQK